jgi:hypothetical protein
MGLCQGEECATKILLPAASYPTAPWPLCGLSLSFFRSIAPAIREEGPGTCLVWAKYPGPRNKEEMVPVYPRRRQANRRARMNERGEHIRPLSGIVNAGAPLVGAHFGGCPLSFFPAAPPYGLPYDVPHFVPRPALLDPFAPQSFPGLFPGHPDTLPARLVGFPDSVGSLTPPHEPRDDDCSQKSPNHHQRQAPESPSHRSSSSSFWSL